MTPARRLILAAFPADYITEAQEAALEAELERIVGERNAELQRKVERLELRVYAFEKGLL